MRDYLHELLFLCVETKRIHSKKNKKKRKLNNIWLMLTKQQKKLDFFNGFKKINYCQYLTYRKQRTKDRK